MGQTHPEIAERHDTLLRGIYHALTDIREKLLPEKDALPRYTALSMSYLEDIHAAVLLGDAPLSL